MLNSDKDFAHTKIIFKVGVLKTIYCHGLAYRLYQGAKRTEISKWVSDIEYYSHHREMNSRVLHDTGNWLFARQEFKVWNESDRPSFLWLRGNAGTGKTSLVSCVIQSILERPRLNNDEAFAYFYCSRTSSNTVLRDPRAILHSIIRQIAAPFPGLPIQPPVISVYNKEVARGSETKAQLSDYEITDLLTELIQHRYKKVTLIVDALDECDVKARALLLDVLSKLTYNPESVVKTLVSSRNDPDITNHFLKTPNLSITATDNADDIMKFVSEKISQDLLSGTASDQLKERVTKDLNQKANGVFRWVALQVDALCDPYRVFSQKDVEYLLSRLPETLEDTYSAIVRDLDKFTPPSCQAIKNTIKLMICAEYPIDAREMLEALSILSGEERDLDEATILKMGRGLIVKESPYRPRFVFAHLSVKEFFEKRTEYSGEYAHAVAAEACLEAYLKLDPSLPGRRLNFLVYANTHLGRHYMKSGSLRQKPKLRVLMEEFIFGHGPGSAFEKWNRFSFRSSLELAPGTNAERMRCVSRPALPLFMICVYGYNEFVERAIQGKTDVHYAQNTCQERPMEVAAFYGNYSTLKLLHDATSLLLRSPIRPRELLSSAANSRNLDVWRFAIRHIPVIPLKSAITEAVRSSEFGKEMLCSLLHSIVEVHSEDLADILRSCASFDILNIILNRFPVKRFTGKMLNAAVKNRSISQGLVEMILSKQPDIRVTETTILSASWGLLGMQKKRTDVMKTLLAHPKRCEITEEIVYRVIEDSRDQDDVECLEVLLQNCSMDHITEDWLAAAANRSEEDLAPFQYLLNHPCNNKITLRNLQKAVVHVNEFTNAHCLKLLFSRPGCPQLLDEDIYRMMEKGSIWIHSFEEAFSTITPQCEPVYATEAYLQACATRLNTPQMQYALSRPRAIPVTESVVIAAFGNFKDAANMVKMLLQTICSFALEPSENTLFRATSNYGEAYELVRILAECWGHLPVTERCMAAASRNDSNGTETFKFLLKYWTSDETPLSDSVLLAAIRGDNMDFVEYFQRQRPDFKVNEEHLIAAINPYSTNMAILRILLAQLGESPIPVSVLEKAQALKGEDESMLELILERPSAPETSFSSLELDEGAAPIFGGSGVVTFEEIESATAKERGLDDIITDSNCHQLSTTKIDLLLSRYTDPTLDSNRLIEVAAETRNGKFIVQYLLSRFPQTVITRQALLAAIKNEKALTSLLDFLLQRYSSTVDTELLRVAAANKFHGTQMIELLLSKMPPDTEIERDVITAALENPYCGRSLLELILRRQSHLPIREDIVTAASQNSVQGNVLLQLLLKQALTLRSPEAKDLVVNQMRTDAHGLRDFLFMAACYGDESILGVLLSHGASIATVSCELGTPLNVAVHAAQAHIVEILLENGSDPNYNTLLYGTPLHSACRKGDAAIANMLSKYGADIDRPDENGRTALHTALRDGSGTQADICFSLEASVTARDHQGMAAIHHASIYEISAQYIPQLLARGASTDQEDSQHWTALHWAAKSGNVEAATLLLEAGASKIKLDASGKSPLQIAMFCGNIHLRPQLFVSNNPNLDKEPMGKKHDAYCDSCIFYHTPSAPTTSAVSKQIIERVNKCFTRAEEDKANKQEAKAAMKMAATLKKKYFISQADQVFHEVAHQNENRGGQGYVLSNLRLLKKSDKKKQKTMKNFQGCAARRLYLLFSLVWKSPGDSDLREAALKTEDRVEPDFADHGGPIMLDTEADLEPSYDDPFPSTGGATATLDSAQWESMRQLSTDREMSDEIGGNVHEANKIKLYGGK
ncbi:MAG: hypothetical protein Q9208_008606 [Pyrenodesmia sp. 3 TL-2023]